MSASLPATRAALPATSLSALVGPDRPQKIVVSPRRLSAARPAATLVGYVGLGIALAALVVSGLTLGHSKQPQLSSSVHHGTASLKRTQKGNDVRWRQAQTIVLLDSSLDKLGPSARQAIREAFSAWLSANPALPHVAFKDANSSLESKLDGKNTIVLAPITVSGHEHDLAITLTYSDEETGDIVEADVIINSEYPFRVLNSSDDGYSGDPDDALRLLTQSSESTTQATVSASRASCTVSAQRASCDGSSYDIQNVATHEVGHFFGLGEDMDDASTTMYYCTSRCETHKRVLTVSDAAVIGTLYAESADELSDSAAAGCGGARIAARGGVGESAWAIATVGLGLLGLFRRRSALYVSRR